MVLCRKYYNSIAKYCNHVTHVPAGFFANKSTDPWLSWADPEGGGGQGVRNPLKNHKNRVSSCCINRH